jgi:hypothetical protein
MIYALARVKLREDLYRSFEELDRSMAHEQLRALKSSIEQFEADFTDDTDPPSLQSKPQLSHWASRPLFRQSSRAWQRRANRFA